MVRGRSEEYLGGFVWTTVDGVVALEGEVLRAPSIDEIVLRYGQFYGPGTLHEQPSGLVSVHVNAAAHAAVLAIDLGAPGIYNVADPNGAVDSGKAQRELGWSAHYRDGDG